MESGAIIDQETLTHAFERASDTLYIPHHVDAANFRLRFHDIEADDADESDTDIDELGERKEPTGPDFSVDFFHNGICETEAGRFNTICTHDDIVFAIKRESEQWHKDILAYTKQPALPNAETADAKDESREEKPQAFGTDLRFAVTIAAIVLLGAAVTYAGWWQVNHYLRSRKVAGVATLLRDAPTQNHVLPGDDGKVYVLSATQQGAEWDRQVVLKAAPTENIDIETIKHERERIEQVLDTQGVDFITVRMDSPERPVLIVNAAMAPKRRNDAGRHVASAAPYATTVFVQPASIAEIESEARAALTKMGLSYRRLRRRNGATYEIAGALGDADLVALQELVSQFSRKWGTRCVDFKVAMRTDWLKGKTYRVGGDGYVLLDHTSWFFPQLLKGAK